ncbi:MAG: imidazoleglycerol-phosphate dehydratase HisB [Bacillota bacterium]
MRVGEVKRSTSETGIDLSINLDGSGTSQVDSGVPFLNHMLDLLARHALVDLTLRAEGDTEVDDHHTVEDIGICLGHSIKQALGDKKGVARYGHAVVPMDEALVLVAIDLSGRSCLAYEVNLTSPRVGSFDTELVEEFLRALVTNSGLTMHVKMLAGKNVHHIIEAIFKGLGRALRAACALDPRETGIPSTKGML